MENVICPIIVKPHDQVDLALCSAVAMLQIDICRYVTPPEIVQICLIDSIDFNEVYCSIVLDVRCNG